MAKSIDSIKKNIKQTSKSKNSKPKKQSKILANLINKAKKPLKFKLTRKYYLIFGSIITLFVLYVIFCIASDMTLKNVIYPNVWVGSINVGNQTSDSAQNIISQKSKSYLDSANLTVKSNKDSFQLKPIDINTQFDLHQTTQNLMNIGHNHNIIVAGFIRIRLAIKPIKTAAVVNFDSTKWNNFTADVSKKIDVPYQNAGLKIDNGQISETPSSTGIQMNPNDLENKTKIAIGTFDTGQINIVQKVSTPDILIGDLVQARKDAEAMMSGPLDVVYKNKDYNVTANTIGTWITFPVILKIQATGVETSVAAKSKNKYIIVARLDDKKLNSFVDKIDSDIDVAPKNVGLAFTNGALQVTSPSVTGTEVDRNQLFLDIQNTLENNSYRKVTIKTTTKTPDVREDNLASLGIIEQISEGVSTTSGSPANRIHNIQTGAAKFNGVLISPGEVFSFDSTLGPVDASTGYLPELVILENKTVPEYGGGLCQVSTTTFRAALLAGLPITERHPHAYRVKYYDWPYGPGVDSTIYPPSPDLKFKNDTGSWILIQTHIDGTKLYFDFYGTKNGRSAVINTPQVLYSNPDGSMGTVFTRDVFVNNVKTRTDTFQSAYKSAFLYPHSVVENGAPPTP